jgi:hypothetical protein
MSQHEYPHCALSVIPTALGFTVMRMYNDGSDTPVKERWLVQAGELEERIAALHENPTYSPEVILHANHRHTEH